MKGLSAQNIHDELIAVLGSDAIGYSTVTKYLRQTRRPPIPMETLENPPNTVTDDAILDTFQQQLFSLVRELAKLTCIQRSTIHRHLIQTLGFVVKHLRWVPHSLTDAQKPSHVFLANQLLSEFCSIKHHGWEFIVTLDES
jgi:hypothetical protein